MDTLAGGGSTQLGCRELSTTNRAPVGQVEQLAVSGKTLTWPAGRSTRTCPRPRAGARLRRRPGGAAARRGQHGAVGVPCGHRRLRLLLVEPAVRRPAPGVRVRDRRDHRQPEHGAGLSDGDGGPSAHRSARWSGWPSPARRSACPVGPSTPTRRRAPSRSTSTWTGGAFRRRRRRHRPSAIPLVWGRTGSPGRSTPPADRTTCASTRIDMADGPAARRSLPIRRRLRSTRRRRRWCR